MAGIFNGRRVEGVKVFAEGETFWNGRPVVGVRETEELFLDGFATRPVEETEDLFFGGAVTRGVVVTDDDRAMYNGSAILPVQGLWSPAALFASGQPGHWPGGCDPAAGRLFVSSTTPALLPGELIHTAQRLAGSVDAIQTTGAQRPTLVRWPKGGRRNIIVNSTATGAVADPVAGTPPTGWSWGSGAKSLGIDGDVLTFTGVADRSFIRQTLGRNIAGGQTEVWGVTVAANSGLTYNQIFLAAGLTAPATAVYRANGSVVSAASYVPAPGDRLTVTITGGATGSTDVAFRMGAGTSGNATGTVSLRDPQIETGAAATPYQRVTTANDVTEAGQPSVWHLFDDGGDSLPVTLPAGTYGRAVVDHLGAITVDTVTDPANALVAERQADVILRQGPFSTAEIARLAAYWQRYAA